MDKLKIRTYGMMSAAQTAGNAQSWVYTVYNLMKSFDQMGHELFLQTTNGVAGIDKKWFKYFRDCKDPDIDINYTLPQNIYRLSGTLSGTKPAKMRCLIFNYESSILPGQWGDYSKHYDYWLPSSEYCADIFRRAGVPSEKIVTIPLGVDFESLNGQVDFGFKLKTQKRFKLLNISIPHARKNIPHLIDSYYEEFSAKDDICLVIKTSLRPKNNAMDTDVSAILNELKIRYKDKKLPEVEIVDYRFNNIATIYKQTNALICVSASEGWWLCGVEAMAMNKLVACPRYGGALDFCNHNKNSLLIDTIEIKAPPEMQYWEANNWATVGFPLKESICRTMRNLYENEDILKKSFGNHMNLSVKQYTWNNSAQMISDLYNGVKPIKQMGELL